MDDFTAEFAKLGISSTCGPDRRWTEWAVALLDADNRRSADTHLIHFHAHNLAGIDIYLKDESVHPTGSLKHRLARSLFLFGVCNGRICENTAVVEASSGSTAVSEAYFARLLGLAFHAVMPRSTSPEKIAAIEAYAGICHFVDDPCVLYETASALAASLGGIYMDQFTNAERVTDWRGNNNIAESLFEQMQAEVHPVPDWVVMSAGTGGTTATIGRYIRYRRHATRLCAVDVENSVFYESFQSRDRSLSSARGSRIEGIGRPRVEPSFIPEVIDRMIRMPDAASLAAMRVLSRRLGRRVGGSTGANFAALCLLATEIAEAGQRGSLITLICDSGERYAKTYYNDAWLEAQGLDIAPWVARFDALLDRKEKPEPLMNLQGAFI